MTAFTDLVDDVVFVLIEHIERERDLNSLSRTMRHLHHLLNWPLYSRHAQLHRGVALNWAAQHDRVNTAQRLLAAGADVMAPGSQRGYTYPLFIAAKFGSVNMVKLLLETEGVCPDRLAMPTIPDGRTSNGVTSFTSPLALAAKNGHSSVVRLLLSDIRVDPQRHDTSFRNGLSYAALYNHEEIVDLFLMDPRVDPNRVTAFGGSVLSVANCLPNVVRRVLDCPRLDLASVDGDGRPALTQMIYFNTYTLDTIRPLLAHPGCDPGANDDSGGTALIYAAQDWGYEARINHEDLIDMLLGHPRCDAGAVDANRHTALIYAAKVPRDNANAIRRLLADPRCDPEAVDRVGCTALSHAASSGNVANMQALIEHGVNVDVVDENGRTLFTEVIKREDLDALRLLLSTPRVNPNMKDSRGCTPLVFSMLFGSRAATNVLASDERVLPKGWSEDKLTALINSTKAHFGLSR